MSEHHMDGEDLCRTVRAAAAGDDRAWAAIIARFGTTIRAVARRHRLNHADQEEILQRTWLRLIERIHTIREPAAMAGWLATTARRECLRLQGARAREVMGGDVPVTVDTETVDETVIAAERADALHGAVDRLTGRQRALMKLQLVQPALGYDEIGSALGLPVGSIGPTRGRSLDRLRQDPWLRSALAAA